MEYWKQKYCIQLAHEKSHLLNSDMTSYWSAWNDQSSSCSTGKKLLKALQRIIHLVKENVVK